MADPLGLWKYQESQTWVDGPESHEKHFNAFASGRGSNPQELE
jgi:hypothetical protein